MAIGRVSMATDTFFEPSTEGRGVMPSDATILRVFMSSPSDV